MAFIRKRVTKAGTTSTTLIESYRDADGKPRQRTLVNLHGAETTLQALARLAAQRHELREEMRRLQPDLKAAEQWHGGWMAVVAVGRLFSREERLEIEKLLRARKRLLKRAKQIDAALSRIEREGRITKEYCGASSKQVQASIKDYQKKLNDAQALVVGSEYGLKEAKGALKRLMS